MAALPKLAATEFGGMERELKASERRSTEFWTTCGSRIPKPFPGRREASEMIDLNHFDLHAPDLARQFRASEQYLLRSDQPPSIAVANATVLIVGGVATAQRIAARMNGGVVFEVATRRVAPRRAWLSGCFFSRGFEADGVNGCSRGEPEIGADVGSSHQR